MPSDDHSVASRMSQFCCNPAPGAEVEHDAHLTEQLMKMSIPDFQKAFDTVPHQRLLQKLTSFGIHGNYNVLKWIESFLSNRRQQVVLNGIS